MTSTDELRESQPAAGLSHEALFYSGAADFQDKASPFVTEGLDAGEAVMVMVAPDRIESLSAAFPGGDVSYVNMRELGRNPARIIPAWARFVEESRDEGRVCRGIGEPVWAGRMAEELTESLLHESLLNTAFVEGEPWRLLCPYDTSTLDGAVIEEAMRTHPFFVDGELRPSQTFSAHFDPGPLPHEPESVEPVPFDKRGLGRVRRVVADTARGSGLDETRVEDFILAVNEIATNSVMFGGGGGEVSVWSTGSRLICEVSDQGHIGDPLAGRRAPRRDQVGGRGIWLANQMCDLVQLRSTYAGNVVRLHMVLDGR